MSEAISAAGVPALDTAQLKQQLRRAERAGVNVIMGCGRYIDDFLTEEMGAESVDEIAREMVADILRGTGDSGVRAGIIGEAAGTNVSK